MKELLRGKEIERDWEKVQKMNGSDLLLQLRLWKRRLPALKITMKGNLEEKKEKLRHLLETAIDQISDTSTDRSDVLLVLDSGGSVSNEEIDYSNTFRQAPTNASDAHQAMASRGISCPVQEQTLFTQFSEIVAATLADPTTQRSSRKRKRNSRYEEGRC